MKYRMVFRLLVVLMFSLTFYSQDAFALKKAQYDRAVIKEKGNRLPVQFVRYQTKLPSVPATIPDFAWIFAYGSATGLDVTDTNAIIFDGIDAPVGTNISYDTGLVTINDIGYYQVSFGVNLSTNSACTFKLYIDTSAAPNARVIAHDPTPGGIYVTSVTTVVHITKKGTILSIRNTSGATINLNSADIDTTSLAAYIAIAKLN